MTCLEAQSQIIAYIDYNLDRDKKEAFLKHIETCENCKEELDIYYTMIVGMRQLDDNRELSKDFTKELNERIHHDHVSRRKKHGAIRLSAVAVVVLGITVLCFVYHNFLILLEQKEQSQLKEAQGQYYYYENFADVMFDPYERTIQINVEDQTPKQPTFYERVRSYRAINN